MLAATGCRPAPKAGDFDGDGKAEIVVVDVMGAPARWRRYTWGQATPVEIVVAADGSTMTPVPGTYDGLPGLDPAWVTAAGDWISKGGAAPISFPHSGPPWVKPGQVRYHQIPVPGYYDGGTTTIPAWYDELTATWAIKGHEPEVFGSGPSDPLHQAGASRCGSGSIDHDWPVPADYDGDKKTDLAVYNQTTGQWRIRQSFDGTERTVGLGGPRAFPAPADYDGDGKTDPAVLDVAGPAIGTWRIEGQPDRTFPRALEDHAGSIPAPADYLGDGAVDLAVFNSTAGSFMIEEATPTSSVRVFAGGGGGSSTWPVTIPHSVRAEQLRGTFIAAFCP